MKKKTVSIVLVVLTILIVLAVAVYFIYRWKKSSDEEEEKAAGLNPRKFLKKINRPKVRFDVFGQKIKYGPADAAWWIIKGGPSDGKFVPV